MIILVGPMMTGFSEKMVGELIYTFKFIQPGIFSRFKPNNLLLSTTDFQVTIWKNVQVD